MNKQQTFRLPASARPALLLLAAFLFYAPTLDAQVVKFQKTYAPTDLPAWGYCVQQTADGGYITAGWSNDEFPGYRDALLVKTSAAGVLQWTFDYDLFGPNYSLEEARYVIEVDDRVNGVFDGIPDAYVMVGWRQKILQGPIDNLPPVFDDRNILAVKVDLNGNVIWIKEIGDAQNDYHEQAFCVKQNPVTGNYVLTGAVEYQTTAGTPESRLLLMELDARTGAINWDHAYGWPNATIGVPETGGYSLSTYDRWGIGAPEGWVVCGWTTDETDPNNRTEEDLYLIATDWYGNPYPSYLKRYGVSTGSVGNFSIERGFSVQQRANGDVIVSGEYQPTVNGGSPAGPMLLSVSRNLATVNFMRSYNIPSNATMYSAYSFRESTPVNGIPGFVLAAGGSSNAIPVMSNEPTPMLSDAIMFHTDLTGLTVNWGHKYYSNAVGGIPGYGNGHSVRATSNGYIMAGVDISLRPGMAAHLVKTDLFGVTGCHQEHVNIDVDSWSPYVRNHGSRLNLELEDVTPSYSKTPRVNEEVHCYSTFKPIPAPGTGEEPGSHELQSRPNPVRNGEDLSLSFDLSEEGPATLTVTDLLGKVIHTQTAIYPADAVEVRIPTADWTAGTYTVTLHSKEGTPATQKVLVTD